MALPHISSHEEYRRHLHQFICSLKAQSDLLHLFHCCELAPMVAFLSKLYSPMGRTAYDPTAMLGASLLLITQVPCKSLHGIPDFLAGNPPLHRCDRLRQPLHQLRLPGRSPKPARGRRRHSHLRPRQRKRQEGLRLPSWNFLQPSPPLLLS